MIDETVEEIREMRTHSSSAVAVKAARALEELLDRDFATVEEFERSLTRNSNALRRANRSHASLHTTQQEILDAVESAEPADVEAAKQELEEAIERAVTAVQSAKTEAAERAAATIAEVDTILTHDYSSTVLEAIEQAVADGADLTIYATEARPRYLGRRTARTLAELEGVDVTLLVDGAAGHYLPECDRVVVGMDCIVDDTLYNRVGTYPIAATADDLGVPVEVVGSSAKLVDRGFSFENDFRSVSEVMREPAEGFEIGNPAYDATPTRLIDRVITESGIESP